MSLKALHLAFIIIASIGACIVGAMWTGSALRAGALPGAGMTTFIFGVALIVYGVGFYARSGELPWI